MSIEWAAAIIAIAMILFFIAANWKDPHAPA
jgi:hypothetical protein